VAWTRSLGARGASRPSLRARRLARPGRGGLRREANRYLGLVARAVAGSALTAGLAAGVVPATRSQSGATASGQVVNGVTGEPVPAAMIRLHRLSGGVDKAVAGDAFGRFAVANLPGGRYRISASASGFFPGEIGQTEYRGPNRSTLVDDGDRVGDLVVPLWPPAAIRGSVRDAAGSPVAGSVFLLRRADDWDGNWEAAPGAPVVTTDASGRYAFDGIEPASYVVAVRPQPSTAPSTFAPTFAPAARRVSDAGPLAVASGETRQDADVTVSLRTRITVAGHLVGAPAAVAHAIVRLCPSDAATRSVGLCLTEAWSAVDGQFTLSDVVAGSYLLEAEVPNSRAGAGPVAWGRRAAVIGGADVVDADVPMQATSSVSGHVTLLDGPATVPDGLIVSMAILDPLLVPTGAPGDATLQAPVDRDGRFTFDGLRPGEYLVVDRSNVPGWFLASADVGGQDGADQPFTVSGDVQTPDLGITLAHASATVRGTVRQTTGDPAEEATVLLFSAEPQFWHPLARRVFSGHVGARGEFAFSPVPPGDYYLTATEAPLDRLALGVLEAAVTTSQKIHVNMGQTLSADLTLPNR
jgi:protocatechuate 3,4-dioxygenase beta subunit